MRIGSTACSFGGKNLAGRILPIFSVMPRLVVEVDGATHWTDTELARDARRDAWFAQQGFLVLRVTNDDVYREFEAVMETIWMRASARLAPSPALPRFAGEGADSGRGQGFAQRRSLASPLPRSGEGADSTG